MMGFRFIDRNHSLLARPIRISVLPRFSGGDAVPR